MSDEQDRILISGGGPVGLVAALALAQQGIPVEVFEATVTPSTDQRAISYHPPTMDMLDALGVGARMCREGFANKTWQLRDAEEGLIAEIDFSEFEGELRHPYRLYLGQDKLVPILMDALRYLPQVKVHLGAQVTGLRQGSDSVSVAVLQDGQTRHLRGRWLIGADGAKSAVRKAISVEFEGFTWPELYVVAQGITDLTVSRGYATANNIRSGEAWLAAFKLTAAPDPSLWRIVYPASPEGSDTDLLNPQEIRRRHTAVLGEDLRFDLSYSTTYRVHQRVAALFRVHRVFLAGDAAHVNQPLGGMGLNSGIHDAVNLSAKLGAVWRKEADAPSLDRYERQRRHASLAYVQAASIMNKRMLEERDPVVRKRFYDEMRRMTADKALRLAHMRRTAAIDSLREVEAIA